MTRKRTLAFLAAIALLLCADCWPRTVRAEDEDLEASTRSGARKKSRKPARVKATTPGLVDAGGELAAGELPALKEGHALDEKSLSGVAGGELAADLLSSNRTARNKTNSNHYVSPFNYSNETLNQTHANMFKV